MDYSASALKSKSSKKLDICVVIIAFNEEIHIERSIQSVFDFAQDILVIDSFSTDKTVEIALSLGARVLKHKFVSHSSQFQWGIDNGSINSAWIMRLDADEIVEQDLSVNLRETLPLLKDDVVGINLDRKHVFMGRWIKHGGRYPIRLLRIWRTNHGKVEDRWMDEHVVVWGGRTINMKGGFSDINLQNMSFFIEKHNKYATREAIDRLSLKYNLFHASESKQLVLSSLQGRLKRFAKEHIYNRIPFYISPFIYFIYRYIFQLGFLDGREGLIYHVLQGFWYRFLVGSKIYELERLISGHNGAKSRIEIISEFTGVDLKP